MAWELSDEQEMLRQTVRDFAEAEIAPHAAQWDRDHHFPVDVVQAMGELGSCLGLNFLRDPRYYAVEQVDVVIGIVVRAGEKEVGDAAKDIRLLVGRSRCEGPLDLSDNRSLFKHGFGRPGYEKNPATCSCRSLPSR